MSKIFYTLLLLCFYAADCNGYDFGKHRHHVSDSSDTLAWIGESKYDIKHIKFNLNLSDTSVFVQGDVTTTAQVIAQMRSYVFELEQGLQIDSAKINGVLFDATTTGTFVRTIDLPRSLDPGEMFTAQIFYHGFAPTTSENVFFNGLTHSVSTEGTNMVFSLSAPYMARNWWSCKQSLDDKIDSVDMYVTVPAGVYAGSNGLLIHIDSTSKPGKWKFHWQTHYPIDYYLISVAVARYSVFESYSHFSGSTDSMLIQNFFMDTAYFDSLYKPRFDSVGMIIDYFSSLFGRYPFWKEKYGMCYTTLPGGMEHQTMTTIGQPVTAIIAHELCHQWFGDDVTFQNWHDIWLSEGFACYAELLFYTKFYGSETGLTQRKLYMQYGMDLCGSVYVNDTLSPDSIFYQPTVYYKAQAVIHTLRYLAPNDSVFFHFLQTYLKTYAYSVANTAQFKEVAEKVYGMNLDTFFNEWIYGNGFPVVSVAWNQVKDTIIIRLIQNPSCPANMRVFSTPFEVKLKSAQGDTILKLYDNRNVEYYNINWNQTVDTVLFNPDAWTLAYQYGDVKKNSSLPATGTSIEDVMVFPLATNDHWQVYQLPEGTSLTLRDVYDKIVWEGASSEPVTIIPTKNLVKGYFFLKAGKGAMKPITLEYY